MSLNQFWQSFFRVKKLDHVVLPYINQLQKKHHTCFNVCLQQKAIHIFFIKEKIFHNTQKYFTFIKENVLSCYEKEVLI